MVAYSTNSLRPNCPERSSPIQSALAMFDHGHLLPNLRAHLISRFRTSRNRMMRPTAFRGDDFHGLSVLEAVGTL
jgi:hypothetical protein